MIDFAGTFIGFPAFIAYFAIGLAILGIFMALYTWLTPYDEMALVRANNATAALVWVGTLIGYSLPIASAMHYSTAVLEFLMWGVIAGIAQLAVFYGYRRVFPRMYQRIEANEIATGINLAGAAIAVGILNAAAMSEYTSLPEV